MTTSYWNKDELVKQFAHCATVKDVIQTLETDFSHRGEVICEIRINGMILDENDELRFANNALSGINDLAIKTDRPGDLINGALASARDFIPQLDESVLKTAELLRGADLARARESFLQTVDGCQWLADTLNHVRGAASGIKQPVAQPERWVQAEALLVGVVREVSAAFENKDSVLIADLIEYELTSAIELWRNVVIAEIERRS